MIKEEKVKKTIALLISKHGESFRPRIEKGVAQAAALWQKEDGTEKNFQQFCVESFFAEQETLDTIIKTFEKNYESIYGNLSKMHRDITEPIYVDTGEISPIDYVFGEYLPTVHFIEDMFKCKVAFFILLNFPHISLGEKLKHGEQWTAREWTAARIADMFTSRIPAQVLSMQNRAYINAQNYINQYNLFLGNILDEHMAGLFPKTLRLISHWGLRDELKAQYKNSDGLKRQECIYQIMLRIIEQSIPSVVVNNQEFYWNPKQNLLFRETGSGFVEAKAQEEKTIRYQHLLNIFHAERKVDSYVFDAPTHIERRFNKERQMPEPDVENLFISVCKAPVVKKVARLIKKRIGRPLQLFDIWYNGFNGNEIHEQELDTLVNKKYPTVYDFQRAIPAMLFALGFSAEKVAFISEKIVVDAARGAGHALAPGMRKDTAHLRTRVSAQRMNYKGYNVAMHELGHCVEQIFSMHATPNYLLTSVPNTAFTECFAFIFQRRDLENLGLQEADHRDRHLFALKTVWETYEICGVALVDMRVWRYLYAHPDIDATALKEAVIRIAKDVWDTYYASVFGISDSAILAIYSHMIDAGMYLPDYPLGHLIAFQLEKYLEGKNLGTEIERMCSVGYVTPQHWMKNAVGTDISTEPLLQAAEEAVRFVTD